MRSIVGVDLVDIGEIRDSIERFGARFLDRVFAPSEVAYAAASPAQRDARLAARFAAKEAVLKLLEPEADVAIPWRAIEVQRMRSGACAVVLLDEAKRLAEARGIAQIALSLTHHGSLAVAVATALSD